MNPAVSWPIPHSALAGAAADGPLEDPAPECRTDSPTHTGALDPAELDELVRASRNGCPDAFARLVERHLGAVFNYLWRLTANPHDAEDLTQETFLKAWRGIRRFQSSRAFLPWLYVIARRTALNHFRSHHPTVEFTDSMAEAEPGLDPDHHAEQQDVADSLWRVARRLKPRQYEVLWLHYAEGLEVADIARILRTGRIHVRVLLHRARQELGRRLRQSAWAAELPCAGSSAKHP